MIERFKKDPRPATLILRIEARQMQAVKLAALEAKQNVSEFTRSKLGIDALMQKYSEYEFSITKKTK